MAMLLLAAIFVTTLTSSTSFPVSPDTEAMLFLQKYGYMEESTRRALGAASAISQETLAEALTEFQRFSGLNQTGKLDEATLSKMRSPRCGVKDKVGLATSVRRKRYALQGSQWHKTSVTYRISKYSARLKDQEKTKREIVKALQMWSEVTPLNFVERKRGEPDIDIRFEEREHGDGDPFDGPDKTLAHAFFPEFGGDAHFDDEEKWTINKKTGTSLFQIAAHEFGHSLGLSHSDNRKALMNPFPPWKYTSSFKLHSDDIKAVQVLYGARDEKPKKMTENTELGPAPNITGSPDLCVDASIDTVTRTQDGNSYVFKADFYWKIFDEGIAEGYPRRISEDWDGMPGDLDASFTRSNGKTFFFKGKKFWRFTNRDMDTGYPKLISARFKGIPVNLDAAFDWRGNDKIYFFKGHKYWRYDDVDPRVSKEFPKSIRTWKGLPSRVDAAFRWEDGHTYFFKGDTYYRFNDPEFEVDAGDPPYPRLSSVWWFGC